MVQIVMEGATPPVKVPGKPRLYPFHKLSPGESFIVADFKQGYLSFDRRLASLRALAVKYGREMQTVFTVIPYPDKPSIRVRRAEI